MLFPLRVIRRIHREGFRCIPEAIRFRIALHRQRPFLQMETALRQAEEDDYQAFIRRHEAPLSAPFTPTMRLSFLIPTYNTPPELLRALADSLLHQSCGAWEACFYDGASTRADTRELLQTLTQEDSRFRVTFGAENRGIAGNTNAALTMATGEFVALCDHDDLLAPDAVRCILEAAQDGADFVYTDEDKVSADGTRFFEPHLKPDFAPDSLRSGNYICHITAASRALMNAVGGLRPGFDGSQDHDLAASTVRKRGENHPHSAYSLPLADAGHFVQPSKSADLCGCRRTRRGGSAPPPAHGCRRDGGRAARPHSVENAADANRLPPLGRGRCAEAADAVHPRPRFVSGQ